MGYFIQFEMKQHQQQQKQQKTAKEVKLASLRKHKTCTGSGGFSPCVCRVDQNPILPVRSAARTHSLRPVPTCSDPCRSTSALVPLARPARARPPRSCTPSSPLSAQSVRLAATGGSLRPGLCFSPEPVAASASQPDGLPPFNAGAAAHAGRGRQWEGT